MDSVVSAKTIRKNWLIYVGGGREELKLFPLMRLHTKVTCVCVLQRADCSPLTATAGYFNMYIDNQARMTSLFLWHLFSIRSGLCILHQPS